MSFEPKPTGPREERPRSRLYLSLAVGTQILSLLDFIYTAVGLRVMPDSHEINPLLDGILLTPWATLGLKLLIIPAALWLLYRFRAHTLAKVGLWLCFLIYLANDAIALFIVLTYWRTTLG